MMATDQKKKIPWWATIGSFVIWMLGIPLNSVPLYIKYLMDANPQYPLFQYILLEKECTFIFVPVCFMLLLEGGHLYHNGKSWEYAVSWFIRILTLILLLMLFVTYIPNVTNELAWMKNQIHQHTMNLCFLITTGLLGFFSFAYQLAKKVAGDK